MYTCVVKIYSHPFYIGNYKKSVILLIAGMTI